MLANHELYWYDNRNFQFMVDSRQKMQPSKSKINLTMVIMVVSAFAVRNVVSSPTLPPAVVQLSRWLERLPSSKWSPQMVNAGISSCKSSRSTLHSECEGIYRIWITQSPSSPMLVKYVNCSPSSECPNWKMLSPGRSFTPAHNKLDEVFFRKSASAKLLYFTWNDEGWQKLVISPNPSRCVRRKLFENRHTFQLLNSSTNSFTVQIKGCTDV